MTTLAAGSWLGPYEIRARVGAGGMGEVYRAHEAKRDRDVAVGTGAYMSPEQVTGAAVDWRAFAPSLSQGGTRTCRCPA